jgi:DNA polymerase III subunit beta
LSIGEFARSCGLSVSALRFYDARDLLKPTLVDAVNGYRMYSVTQVSQARLIRDLRKLGLPLVDVRAFLDGDSDERSQLISRHIAGLHERFLEARELAERIHVETESMEGDMTVMSVVGDEFSSGVDQMLTAVGVAEDRPELHRVLLEAADGALRMVATDSYRLAFRELVAKSGSDASFEALVEGDALRSLRDSLRDARTIGLRVEESTVTLDIDGAEQSVGRAEGAFPDYRPIVEPKRTGHNAQTDRNALLEALIAAPAFEGAISLVFEPGGVVVHGHDTKALVDASYEGPGLRIFLNREYAIDAVGSAIGAEVIIEATWPNSPVVFRSASDGGHLHMLMPLKLDD